MSLKTTLSCIANLVINTPIFLFIEPLPPHTHTHPFINPCTHTILRNTTLIYKNKLEYFSLIKNSLTSHPNTYFFSFIITCFSTRKMAVAQLRIIRYKPWYIWVFGVVVKGCVSSWNWRDLLYLYTLYVIAKAIMRVTEKERNKNINTM